MDIYSDTIFRDLEKLNFSVNEAKVYLTLLKVGPSMAGKISKEASLDRTSVYNAMKLLLKKGVVHYAIEANRRVFSADDPKKIIDYYKEKEDLANQIIPRLRERYQSKKDKNKVILYQGFKGLKTVFQNILDSCGENDEYLIMGSEGQFGEMMPYYCPLFRKLKEKKKIKTKMLIRSGRIKTSKSRRTEYRKVPSDVKSPTTINVYSKKVAIFIWNEKPEAVVIENENVARTFSNYFNFMWKHAKKA
jgi:HTH-type transcriptional regulator, sugar sensing transcriptional regulator